MSGEPVWHGTKDEARELVDSVAHNCSCVFGFQGVQVTTCEPHRMLVSDQRAMDGLLFARYIAGRLQMEEFMCALPTDVAHEDEPCLAGVFPL